MSDSVVSTKSITVYTLGSGKQLIDIADLSQIKDICGGPGKRVTVDGQPAESVSGTPTGNERVTVAPEKGAQG